jgi:hypothetical protein
MTVGSLEPGLRMIVGAVVRRRMAFLERWRQHNVEEPGRRKLTAPANPDDEASSVATTDPAGLS